MLLASRARNQYGQLHVSSRPPQVRSGLPPRSRRAPDLSSRYITRGKRDARGLPETAERRLPQLPPVQRGSDRSLAGVLNRYLVEPELHPSCETGQDHIRSKGRWRHTPKHLREACPPHQSIWAVDVPNGSPKEKPHRQSGRRGDQPASESRLSVLTVADKEIKITSIFPERLEVGRGHFAVAVSLEDPLAPRLPVADQNRGPMTPIRMARDDEARSSAANCCNTSRVRSFDPSS